MERHDGSSGQQRQAERRRERRLPIELWVEAERGDALYFHRAANFSTGGTFFEQTLPEPPGTLVQLRFTLPGSPGEITSGGEVIASRGWGMGVKFVGLKEADRAAIATALERLQATTA